MEVSKIHLSPSELELMQNADIILTKNSVFQKMKSLLEEVQEAQLHFIKDNKLQAIEEFNISPKISRGENYLGLPWLILDFPRISNQPDLFFVRSMFWWGRFFSSTLHVSGKYRDHVKDNIILSHGSLKEDYVGINSDPWTHHFEESNYRPISSLSQAEFENTCNSSDHLKIANHWQLSQWESAPQLLFENWKRLLSLCGSIA